MTDSVDVSCIFTEKFNRKFISDLLKKCFEIGSTTDKIGSISNIKYSLLDSGWHTKFGGIEEVANSISKNSIGAIELLWYEYIDFSIYINLESRRVGIDIPHITLSFDAVYFKEDEDENSPHFYKTNVNKTIELSKELYKSTNPAFVGGEADNPDEYTPMPTKGELDKGIIKDILWFNIFPPKFVRKIGREKLLSAPAWKVEELDDGGILLVLTEHPFYSFAFDVHEHKEKKDEVEKYLGLK